MNKVLKACLCLIILSAVTSVTVSVLNFFNVEQSDYLLYLLWINVTVIFYVVRPGTIDFENL